MVTVEPAGGHVEEIPLSRVIEGILNEAGTQPMRVGDLLDRTEERGFGVLMLILGLPMLIPFLPPGSSTVVGPIYAIFAVQMLTGSSRPWVPQRLRDHVLSSHTIEILRRRGVPIIRTVERLSRPRGIWLEDRLALRLVGVVVLLMGVILLGPFPLLNTLPAISVMLLGMSLINRDAAFMVAGFLFAGLSIGLIGVSAGLIVRLIEHVRSLLH
ncbi:MAG TPA: exopolysaccharide biosynthesis protein [bacterium]|nr:exopolysaccharide biosynthesis protein [bacterium]